MKATTRCELKEMAKRFEANEFEQFVDAVGWQDWMKEYISDPEYTEEYGLEEQDKDRIDEELKDIFNEAQEELQKERENFNEVKLIKEGEYWTLYIGDENCGCGRFENMVEELASIENYENAKKYVEEIRACR